MKTIISSAIVALIVSVVALGTAIPQLSQDNNLGAVYNTVRQTFNSGIEVTGATSTMNILQLGSSGTALQQVITGTCNLVGGTIAATSSSAATCAVTGVQSGDLVFATLATSTAGAVLTGARASTTSGYITVRLLNLTGGASSVSALGSSTAYFIVR